MNKLKDIISREGDYHEWQNTLKCYIRRNPVGAWCGYVVIPKNYPIDFEQEIQINCHGGITYQSTNDDGDLVIGFDCAHFNDLVPEFYEDDPRLKRLSLKYYKTKEFAIDEVNNMVSQVLKIVSVQRQIKINTIMTP